MLLLTGLAYNYIQQNIQQQGKARLKSQSQAIANAINIRLNRDIYLLYSLRGLYTASNSVERSEFKAFGDGSQLSENFPGIYAISFVEKVLAENKDSFVESIRNDTSIKPEGYPEFKIYPEGDKSNYLPLKYVYPEEKGVFALGFDFGAEENRSAAMEEALKNDQPAITKRIQIIGSDENAFVIFLPVYKNGFSFSTEAERKENLSGYVGVLIEVERFFDSITQSEKIDWTDLDLYIYDQSPDYAVDENNLLYDVDKEEADEDKSELPNFYDLPLSIAGKTWTLHFVADEDYGISNLELAMAYSMALFGLIFSFFIAGAFYFLGTSRSRALNLAEEMTAKLRESEEKYRTIIDNIDMGIYRVTLKGGGIFMEANPAIVKIFGFESKEEFMKTKAARLYSSESGREPVVEELKNKGVVNELELEMKRKDGKTIWVSMTARAHRDKKGNIDWIDGAMEDITEKKELTEKEKSRNEELKRTNTLMVNRELKMIELKKEIEKLKKQKSV